MEAFHSIRDQATIVDSRHQTSIWNFKDQSNSLETRQKTATPTEVLVLANIQNPGTTALSEAMQTDKTLSLNLCSTHQ